MKTIISLVPFVGFIALGILFANRWLVNPPPKVSRFPRGLRKSVLFLSSWIGTFVAFTMSRHIRSFLHDGIAYDEGAEMPYLHMYDGVGDNVLCLFFGWTTGWVFHSIAICLMKEKTEQIAVAND